MLLADKVIVISGVGPGLGRALVMEAASEGASVVAVARTASFVESIAAEVAAAGGRALAVPGDITDTSDCARVAAATDRAFGRLDGLVNSAFTAGPIARFEDADLDAWRQVYEVNVFGTLSLTRALLPLLRADAGAAVINVNTTSALRPMQGQGAYGSSKAAMELLTRQLAVELGPSGIRFNSVYCGPMEGPSLGLAMQSWARRDDQTVDQVRARIATHMALGRVPEDDDAARAIVMLLSDRAAVMTGAVVHATGGAWLEQRI